MTSNDNIITIEMFNAGMARLEEKIVSLQTEIKDTRKDLMTEIRLNQAETRAVHDKVNWGFSLTTVFIGIVGGLALLIPAIKALGDFFASKRKNYATEEQVQNIVDNAISKALTNISK